MRRYVDKPYSSLLFRRVQAWASAPAPALLPAAADRGKKARGAARERRSVAGTPERCESYGINM